MARQIAGLIVLVSVSTVAAGFQGPEQEDLQTISLLGRALKTPPLDDAQRQRLEANLEEARKNLEADPQSIDKLVWVGRRTAYRGLYRQAVEIYTSGLLEHPDSPHLLRHRGHRWITLRRNQEAIADLNKAAGLIEGKADEVEPDGIPNARSLPTSTLQTNIWYHLGLAHYLDGQFDKALPAYRTCLKLSQNDDMRVAASHWLYMTLRRSGQTEEAAAVLEPIQREMDIIENQAYHQLLLLYKGSLKPEELLKEGQDQLQNATLGYGIGNWHLYNGRREEAKKVFEGIVGTEGWAAFGFIAAEAELARMLRQ